MNAATVKKKPGAPTLAAAIRTCMPPPSAAEVKLRLADLGQAAKAAGEGKVLSALLKANAPLGPFLASVSSYSPFLR